MPYVDLEREHWAQSMEKNVNIALTATIEAFQAVGAIR